MIQVSPEELIKLPGFVPESGSDTATLIVQVWFFFPRRARKYVCAQSLVLLQKKMYLAGSQPETCNCPVTVY